MLTTHRSSNSVEVTLRVGRLVLRAAHDARAGTFGAWLSPWAHHDVDGGWTVGVGLEVGLWVCVEVMVYVATHDEDQWARRRPGSAPGDAT